MEVLNINNNNNNTKIYVKNEKEIVNKNAILDINPYDFVDESEEKNFDDSNSTFEDKNIRKKNYVESKERKRFDCKNCGTKFTRKYGLMRHLSQTECDGKVKKKFSCQVCELVFTRKDNLTLHLRNHVNKKTENNYICDLCNADFPTKSTLLKHIRKHEVFYLKCEICLKSFSAKPGLVKHLRIHAGQKPFSCQQCGKSFTARETLNRHKKTHWKNKPYVCKECGLSFIQVGQLQNHLMYHYGKTFKCKYCDKEFKTASSSKDHEKFEHEGCQKLKCPHSDCKKTFMRMGALKTHLTIHTNEKPYECNECKKRFRTEFLLSSHKRTHRKEMTRSCPKCPRAFIRGDCLLRHFRKKHIELYQALQADAIKKKLSKMTDAVLENKIKKLLCLLVDHETLELFNWPDCPIDQIMEGIIQKLNCKPNAAKLKSEKLREDIKLILTLVIDDSSMKKFIENNPIDVVIDDILEKSFIL